MYKMIKAVGKDGTDKLQTIRERHCDEGYFDYYLEVGIPFYFVYNDGSDRMLRSSIVETLIRAGNKIEITTKNSEYWFEKMED